MIASLDTEMPQYQANSLGWLSPNNWLTNVEPIA